MQRFGDQSLRALSLAFSLRYLTLIKLLLPLDVRRTDGFYFLSQVLLLQHEKAGIVTLVKG